jgi:pimeloyl-ACP methyl ester carboxylesterase
MPNIKVNQVSFHYELYGKQAAQPIVFISGYTCDINQWKSVADTFQTTHQVLIFDNQGIGKTQDDGKALSVKSMASNIRQLISALRLQKPIVIGFAFGAGIAAQLAHDYPDEVAGLVLLSATLHFQPEGLSLIDDLYKLKQAGLIDVCANLLYESAFAEAYRKQVSLAEITRMLKPVIVAQNLTDQARQLKALKAYNANGWANKITVPAWVLSPEYDEFATIEEGKALAEACQGVHKLIPASGHAVLFEQPELVASLCQPIVKQLEQIGSQQ